MSDGKNTQKWYLVAIGAFGMVMLGHWFALILLAAGIAAVISDIVAADKKEPRHD